MSALERLRQSIHTENERHRLTMERLVEQHETLRGVLEDQRQLFQELITRVTQLRMIKCERLALGVEEACKRVVRIDTGCSTVDQVLYAIRDRIKAAALMGNNVLSTLSGAAREIVAWTSTRKSSSSSKNSGVIRRTSLAVVTRCEVRGTESWKNKHYKNCSTCGSKRAALRFSEKKEKTVGMAALPDFSRTPGKRFFSGKLRVIKESQKGNVLELLRVSVVLGIRSEDGGCIVDPQATAKQLTAVVMDFVREGISNMKEAIKRAPWNEEKIQNFLLSGAVDMLVHSLDARVLVSPMPLGESPLGVDCTPISVDFVLIAPAFLSTVAPLIELLGNPSQRQYIIENTLQPAARRVGALFGIGEIVTKYSTVALNAFSVLRSIVKHERVEEILRTSPPKGNSSTGVSKETRILDDIHAILLVLAIFGTSIGIECGVPRGCVVNNIMDAKECLLSVAESFLLLLTAPKPHAMLVLDDPSSAVFVLTVLQAPTVFLEILNKTFSSDRRLPRTSRTCVVDYLASPKLKIRYALKYFSEILINFYRPYAQDAGIVVAHDKKKDKGSKPSSCTPVLDLPPDIVSANVDVAQKAELLLQRLRSLQQKAAVETNVERRGKEVVNDILEKIKEDTILASFIKAIKGLRLDVVGFTKVRVDFLLPFGLDVMHPSDQLLYICLEGCCHA